MKVLRRFLRVLRSEPGSKFHKMTPVGGHAAGLWSMLDEVTAHCGRERGFLNGPSRPLAGLELSPLGIASAFSARAASSAFRRLPFVLLMIFRASSIELPYFI